MRQVVLMLAIAGWVMFGAVPAHGQVDGTRLSDTEQQATMATFQYALETNQSDEAAAWVNPDTGTSGSLVPVRTYQNEEGQNCREYVTTIIIDGEEEEGYGTACRQPDGTWMIVSDEPAAIEEGGQTVVQGGEPVYTDHAVNPVYLYPYGYPYWYYDYPYYVWDYYPRIFFSFDIVYFSGHNYHNHYYYPYHHRSFTPWYQAHRWRHVDSARHFRDGRHFSNVHHRGSVSKGPTVVNPGTGHQRSQNYQTRYYGTSSVHRARQAEGVQHFNRARDSGNGRHFQAVRPYRASGRSADVSHRSHVGRGDRHYRSSHYGGSSSRGSHYTGTHYDGSHFGGSHYGGSYGGGSGYGSGHLGGGHR
jgi:surface antigen